MLEELANILFPLPGERTVSKKEVFVLFTPLLTLMVIVLVPVWPSAGIMVSACVEPRLNTERFAFGSRFVFDEVGVTIRVYGSIPVSDI
jgi:hypothetical protein